MSEPVLQYLTAPGSEEMYLIPYSMLDKYVEWCTQCDLYGEDWQRMKELFSPNEIVYKNKAEAGRRTMTGTAVVIVYTVTCQQLFPGIGYHFTSYSEAGKFIGNQAQEVMFGDYNVKASDVHFDITITLMSVEKYETLQKQNEGEPN